MFDRQLLKLIGGNKKYVAFAVLLMVLGMLANIGITASVCWAVYFLIEGYEPLAYIYPAVTAVVAIIVRYVASRCTGSLKDMLGRKVKKDLRGRTYDKILRLGVRSTDGMSMAGLTQVSMEGIEQLDLYYSTYLPQFFFSMIAPILLFCICVGIDWRTSLVLLACVPLIPVSIVAVSKYAKKIFAKYWGKYTSMGDTFLDSVQGLKELKIFKADAARHVKMNASAEEFRKITMKVLVMQLASTTIMDLVAYGGAGAGIALAIVGLMNGWLAPAAALFLVLVAVEFFLPLRSLGSAFHVAMNGASAGRKIISLLNLPDPVWGKEEVTGTQLKLENVTFSYDGKRDVLKNVSMTFPEKGMTAIVGESGCGKSTVVNMLIGAYRPKSGEVTVGGRPLESVTRESYYSHIASVSYNTYIFNDSVRANFEFAKKNVSDEEIWAALEKVNLAGFIKENGGLDKVITEDANNVSGGQKQRLALAVNLVADKDIYVFDEATSNIDIESEAIIMHNIIEEGAHWCDYPWRSANNINQLGFAEKTVFSGDKRVYMAEQFYDITRPVIREYHSKFIRQSVNVFHDNNGVVHSIGLEYTGPLNFMNFWLEEVNACDNHQLVALTATKDVQDSVLKDKKHTSMVDVIDIRQWHYRADGTLYEPQGGVSLALRQHARLIDPGTVSCASVYRAVREYRCKYPDKAVVYNGSTIRVPRNAMNWAIFMAGGSFAKIPPIDELPVYEKASSFSPIDRQTDMDTQWVMGAVGKGYLGYCVKNEINLDLMGDRETYKVFWIDPDKGTVIKEDGSVRGGGKVILKAPAESSICFLQL